MSVWRDVAALRDYVYRSGHVEIMRRRREWFTRMAETYMVLWWVPAGHEPTMAEAVERLTLLRQHGPTARGIHVRRSILRTGCSPRCERTSFRGDTCPA